MALNIKKPAGVVELPKAVPTGELAAVMAAIHKEKGQNVVMQGGTIPQVERIPTGMFEFDLATGGGFPRGRYSIVYGPESSTKTNVTYCAIAQAQRMSPPCNKAVFVDLEGTFDPKWAAQFGVNVDELVVVKPSYGEEAVDLIDALVQADDVAILVVDSLAVVVASKEIEQSAEKFDVGTAAILIKRMCNKLVVALSKEQKRGHTPAVILINQTRFKVGCFDYNARVRLSDGASMKIGEIVNQKLPVEVLSMDEYGMLVPRQVVDWANNGMGDEWLDFRVHGGNSGNRKFKVTPGHTIFTASGERFAKDIQVGEYVKTEGFEYYTPQQHEILLGALLGDGSLRFEKGSPRGHMRLAHGLDQLPYLLWKASLLDIEVRQHSKIVEACTKRSLEFQRYNAIKKKKGLIELPDKFIAGITPLALAIWYMDDGTYGGSHDQWGWGKPSICAKLLSQVTLDKLAKHIAVMGAGLATAKEGRGLQWCGQEAMHFMWAIRNYIPTCMAYKVKTHAYGDSLVVSKQAPIARVYQERVISITPSFTPRIKYDLTIEGNHNYLVDGVVVHNTMFGDPETMPGGQTMKFLSSLTIRLYGKNKVVKEINPDVAAFKEVNAIIKKAKVPVTKLSFEYEMCVYPHDGLAVGETNSWNKVCKDLQQLGHIVKSSKGWKFEGKEYPNLMTLQDTYLAEPTFAVRLQKLIIDSSKGQMFYVESEGAAK